MPVSSPSYFPPNRVNGTVVGINAGTTTTGARNFLAGKNAGAFLQPSDVVVIGDSSLSTGTLAVPLNDANLQYAVIVGSQSGANWAFCDSTQVTSAASVIVGGNNLVQNTRIPATVSIGANVFPNIPGTNPGGCGGNVFVGVGIGQNVNQASAANGWTRNTIIGAYAFKSLANSHQDCLDNVIIGAQACMNAGPSGTGSMTSNVVIGSGAVSSMTNGQLNVYVGQGCGGQQGNGLRNVVIGANADCGGGSSASGNDSTVIGCNSVCGTGGNNTILGSNCNSNSNQATSGNILLGSGAGHLFSAPFKNDVFLVETNYASATQSLIYGILTSGNCIIGNTSPTPTQREWGGLGATNALKLLNGTAGASGPLGGGMFYVSAGALHYVGSSGTDTTLAPA